LLSVEEISGRKSCPRGRKEEKSKIAECCRNLHDLRSSKIAECCRNLHDFRSRGRKSLKVVWKEEKRSKIARCCRNLHDFRNLEKKGKERGLAILGRRSWDFGSKICQQSGN
jgi:hypothetical protein